MKLVKAWEALKAWQEEGRRCRPVDPMIPDQEFDEPKSWKAEIFLTDRDFELEPPRPGVVEYSFDCRDNLVSFYLSNEIIKKLRGKHWRVVCTEILE